MLSNCQSGKIIINVRRVIRICRCQINQCLGCARYAWVLYNGSHGFSNCKATSESLEKSKDTTHDLGNETEQIWENIIAQLP